MWRGGRTTSARRTGRSSSASRAALKSRPKSEASMTGLSQALRTRVKSALRAKGKACDEFCPTKGGPGWKWGFWGAANTRRGTTYVFVNVVVPPRYVARRMSASGGLKQSTFGVCLFLLVSLLAVPRRFLLQPSCLRGPLGFRGPDFLRPFKKRGGLRA